MNIIGKLQKAINDPCSVIRYLLKNGPHLALQLAILSRFPVGKNIFSQEWDLLIVLDACRADALMTVADEYPYIPDESKIIWSRGSSTLEWVPQTFTNSFSQEISNTVCVTASPWIERILSGQTSPEEFYGVGYVPTKWDTVSTSSFLKLQTVLPSGEGHHRHVNKKLQPDRISAKAVVAGREIDPPRLIVHYLHPHKPYIEVAQDENRELYDYEYDPWKYLQNDGDRDVVWRSYLDELRGVLDSVSRLLRNVEAENVVITADHGELFGKCMLEHPPSNFHPKLRRVPWVETSAKDKQEWTPDVDSSTLSSDAEIEEQLEALGYR